MCKSNYDIRVAAADFAARAGAANAYIIIRQLDCKLKRPNMFKKPCLKSKYVQQKTESGRKCANKLVGRHSVFRLLCSPNAHFRNACKNVCRKAKQQKVKRNHCEGTKSFLRSEGKSPNHAFCAHRMRGLSKWSRRICATRADCQRETFWHARGQAHQTTHSVRTECALYECAQKCFKRLKAAKRQAWDERLAAWRRPV